MTVSDPATLAALSEHERQALRLLAQGHTVKSIAEMLGRTPGAVNERLREARRKTGTGSSRELARLLASQENRDMKTGMGSTPGNEARKPSEGRNRGILRYGKGALIMIPIILAIAISAAVFRQESDGATAAGPERNAFANDPILGQTIASMHSPAELYRKVRSEPRDQAWAAPTEDFLAKTYGEVLSRHGLIEPVRVTCGSTMCEVAIKNIIVKNGDTNKLWRDLDSKVFWSKVGPLGLTYDTQSYGPSYAGYLVLTPPK